jgi:hypothetical protein
MTTTVPDVRPAAPTGAQRNVNFLQALRNAPDEVLITPKELEAMSGFTQAAFRLWRREGRGPRCVKVEGRPRYLLRDVRAWLSSFDKAAAA